MNRSNGTAFREPGQRDQGSHFLQRVFLIDALHLGGNYAKDIVLAIVNEYHSAVCQYKFCF